MKFKYLILSFFALPALASELSEQRLVFNSENNDTEYRLSLSALKTVNATIVAEREVLLSGRVERRTFEFDGTLQYREAWDLLNDALDLADYRELFSCDGLSCGSSNAWANDRFEIKQLYGLDQQQKYRALVKRGALQSEFMALYFVQRGNKRIYAQVDKIFTTQNTQEITESASTIINLLEKNAFYSVEQNQNQEFNAQQIQLLAKALKSNPISRFYLVGHCASFDSHEKNIECARSLADQLQKALIESGIPARRIQLHSVGGLTPRPGATPNRVELVQVGKRA